MKKDILRLSDGTKLKLTKAQRIIICKLRQPGSKMFKFLKRYLLCHGEDGPVCTECTILVSMICVLSVVLVVLVIFRFGT